jgi:hypothetical protein
MGVGIFHFQMLQNDANLNNIQLVIVRKSVILQIGPEAGYPDW